MAFRLESTDDGAGTLIESAILMTDSEAGVDGEAVVVTTGRLTKAGAAVAPTHILAQDSVAGTDVATSYIPVRRDQRFLADYTGTAPVVGTRVYQMDSTGLLVNGASATGGKIEILSVDTTNTQCRVRFDI